MSRSAATATAPGGVALVIRPSQAARRVLKIAKRIVVSVAVTFIPTGGTPKTQTLRVSAAGKAKRKRR